MRPINPDNDANMMALAAATARPKMPHVRQPARAAASARPACPARVPPPRGPMSLPRYGGRHINQP